MAAKKEVEQFLKEFKEKLKLTTVFFRDDRGKNPQTLSDLELRPIDRETILLDLKIEDYSDGPLEDTLFKGSDMWVFRGKLSRMKYILRYLSDMEKAEFCVFHSTLLKEQCITHLNDK